MQAARILGLAQAIVRLYMKLMFAFMGFLRPGSGMRLHEANVAFAFTGFFRVAALLRQMQTSLTMYRPIATRQYAPDETICALQVK